ncbi:MAG TPA: SusC/RagA family TonB-linked outer membrane protein [Pedobacter sp.]|jgi:TonB-linked SusC/RagA family outer membrane protein
MRKLLSSLSFVLLWATFALAQERTVTGTVTASDDGSALPGVSIKVKGTTTGTQTGAEGQYSIRVRDNSTLVFSFIGFASQEIAVSGRDVINVTMGTDAQQLGEVVVTALGVTRERKSVGYAATTVTAAEVNRASPTNIVQGLAGKVAGVDISTTSGAPGGSTKVVLRGFSSITGNNQPLYVIDGVPINNSRPGQQAPVGSNGDLEDAYDFGNAANDINPNDIESVNILKGASATSLYGSRGSNGVIVITTKRGKAGTFKVDFSSASSFTQVAVVPEFQTRFGQGWDQYFLFNENGSWGPKTDGMMRPWGAVVNNSQLLKPFSANKSNVFRDVFDTGTEFNNTLSLSGGSESSSFFLSYGNVNADGMMPTNNDSYKRNTLSLRGSTKFKAFTAGASFNYIGKNSRFVEVGGAQTGVGGNYYEDILQMPVDIPIKDLQNYKNEFFNVDNYFTLYAENPFYSINENQSRFKSDRFFGNIDLKLKANDWLTFQFQQGADLTGGRNKLWHAKNAPSPGAYTEGRQPNVGNVVEGAQTFFEYDSKLHGIFEGDISSKFNVSGLVGLNFNDRGFRTLYTSVEDLTIPGFYQLSNSLNSPVSTDVVNHRRLFGAYASATFGYSNFAYLTLNARNDWSSTLPQGANSYFYPGANLALVLSDAIDLKSANISLLKLRASWGQTGNDTDPYRTSNVLTSGQVRVRGAGTVVSFPLNGVAGFSIANTLNNGALRPEISTETEFGTEIRLFKNRIGFDLAYYNRITEDQILPINTSPSSGYRFMIVNFGELRNRGVELAFSATPLKSKNLDWNLGYTFTRNRSKVLSLPQDLDKVIINSAYDAEFVARKGQPLGLIEAPTAQYDPQGRIIVNGPSAGAGLEGFPVTSPVNVSYGSSQRDFIMGLTNSVRFKSLTFGFTLDYRKGGVFYSGTADLLNFVGNDAKTTYNDRNSFIIPNSVVAVTGTDGSVSYEENTYPIPFDRMDDYSYHTNNKALSYNNRILSKDFLKVRDATLTYVLPKSIAKRVRAGDASITLFGRNLWTWLPKENRTIDPEVSNFGNDLRSEFGEFRTGPSTRNFGAALRVSF